MKWTRWKSSWCCEGNDGHDFDRCKRKACGMLISFVGFDNPVIFDRTHASVVQIANESLYARVCQSLISGKGEDAVEPYSIWDDNGVEIRASQAFLPIINPFDLPRKHKTLLNGLYERLYQNLLVDEDARSKLQHLSERMETAVAEMAFQLNGNYGFGLKWDMREYLRAFGFGAETLTSASLFENLIGFVELVADVGLDKTLLFVNLKTFLTENELEELYRTLIFYGIQTLLLENHQSEVYSEFEHKTIIDRHFLEYEASYRSECPSPSQGRICSNGFGAVAF